MHRAAEREGHSQISRLLPAESAVLLPHHGGRHSKPTQQHATGVPQSRIPSRQPESSRIHLETVSTSTQRSLVAVFSHMFGGRMKAPPLALPGQASCLAQTENEASFRPGKLPLVGSTKPRSFGLVSAQLSARQRRKKASVIVKAGRSLSSG